jgi:hypothetical protein
VPRAKLHEWSGWKVNPPQGRRSIRDDQVCWCDAVASCWQKRGGQKRRAERTFVRDFFSLLYEGKCRHSSVGLERLICNQQLVGSNPTAGSNRVSMQESSIASLRRPREGSITARMKWILILLVASASLCFAQGNTAAAPRVSPTPQPHPSPAPRRSPSRFVEPNFLVPSLRTSTTTALLLLLRGLP